MENLQKNENGEKEVHRGIDPRAVFFQLMRDVDPKKVEVHTLQFGIRKRGDSEQIVSILDTGTGEKIEVYPVVSRFQPRLGRDIRCYVITRQKEEEIGGQKVTVTRGFAIPVNLRQAQRDGEWLGIRNNILTLKFRQNHKDGKVSHYAFGPNGKKVIVPDDAGLDIFVGEEANYMVSERLSCYLAHCLVPEDELAAEEKKGTSSLLVLAESVGAVLRGVDEYGFYFEGKLLDACEELKLPATASAQQIEARYRELAKTEHPDAKCIQHRQITGEEPSVEDKKYFNREWQIIEAAKERLLLVRTREKVRKEYFPRGRKALPDLPLQLTVATLASRLKVNLPVIKKALKEIGLEAATGKFMLSQEVAWTAAGLIIANAAKDAESNVE